MVVISVATFADARCEVIYYVLELLSTIEEALQHIQVQIAELRLEEAAVLLGEAAEAIGSIVNCFPLMLTEDGQHQMVGSMSKLRKEMAGVTDAFESSHLMSIQRVVRSGFIPAYITWRKDLTELIRSLMLS